MHSTQEHQYQDGTLQSTDQKKGKYARAKKFARYTVLGILFFALIPFAAVVSFIAGKALGEKNFSSLVAGNLQSVQASQMPQTLAKGEIDFAPFWEAWTLLETRFAGGSNATSSEDVADIIDQDKVWGAISGLAQSYGDPYTTFLPPVENIQFQESISGEFSGVGMEISSRAELLTVVSPLPGTPADRAGVRPKDVIAKINGVDSLRMPSGEAVKLIRGERGSTVTLSIARQGESELLEIPIVRDTINIPVLVSNVVDNVFVIKLYSFGQKSPDMFKEAITEFAKSGLDKLVFDVRGNPGGYLEAAIFMSSFFLDSDKLIVEEDFGGKKENVRRFSKGYNLFNDKLRMVVLTNGGSASASEIVAGSLRDHERALLVGETTFGKGSVQELFPLTNETSLKITIAKWLTPSGDHITIDGIEPDIIVKPRELGEDEERPSISAFEINTDDQQLEKAIEVLKRPDFFSLYDSVPTELSGKATTTPLIE